MPTAATHFAGSIQFQSGTGKDLKSIYARHNLIPLSYQRGATDAPAEWPALRLTLFTSGVAVLFIDRYARSIESPNNH